MRPPLRWLVVALLVSGCGTKPQPTAGVILARVNGQAITQTDFDRRIEELPEEFRDEARRRQRELLEDLVLEELLYQEAQAHRLESRKAVQEAQAQAARRVLIGALVEEEVNDKVQVPDEELAQYYEGHREEFAIPKRYRASHILVKTEQEAQQLRAALKAEADFADLARRHSTDTSKTQGGDIGFFTAGELVPEFEGAALALEVGQTSGIVKSPFGYHLIKLTDRQEAAIRTLEEVKPTIRRRLLTERRQQALDEFLTRIRGKGRIEILMPLGEPQLSVPTVSGGVDSQDVSESPTQAP